MTSENTSAARLVVVPDQTSEAMTSTQQPTVDQLYELTRRPGEEKPPVTQEQFLLMLDKVPGLRDKMVALWQKRQDDLRREQEKQELEQLASVADALIKDVNRELNPVGEKPKLRCMTVDEVKAASTESLEDRIARLKGELKGVLPYGWLYEVALWQLPLSDGYSMNCSRHEKAAAMRGRLIKRCREFSSCLRTAKDGPYKTQLQNKLKSIGAIIDGLDRLLEEGYNVPKDVKTSKEVYVHVGNLGETEEKLMRIVEWPESDADREKREAAEALEKEKTQAEREAAEAEREKMVQDILDLMKKVSFFAKKSEAEQRTIAERVERKGVGSTAVAKLRDCAMQKAGGAKSVDNKTVGRAYGESAGLSPEKLAEMFPGTKEKKEKKNKK